MSGREHHCVATPIGLPDQGQGFAQSCFASALAHRQDVKFIFNIHLAVFYMYIPILFYLTCNMKLIYTVSVSCKSIHANARATFDLNPFALFAKLDR